MAKDDPQATILLTEIEINALILAVVAGLLANPKRDALLAKLNDARREIREAT